MSIYDDKPWLNHFDDGVDPEVSVSADTSYADLFNASVKSNPAAPALHFMGVSFSYGELDDLTGRFAAYLTDCGVAKGDVVGINAAINAAGQGIGFAIPINMAKTLLPMLEREGIVQRSWLGVVTQPMTKTLARSFGMKGNPRGALIADVDPNGAASKAGLRAGDIVLEFAGETISRSENLRWIASTAGVGRRVNVVIWRNRQRTTVPVTLKQLPGTRIPPRPRATMQRPRQSRRSGLGIGVQPIRGRFQPRSGPPGVIVANIDPDGQTAQAGLMLGDVIVEINEQPINSMQSFRVIISGLRSRQIVRMRVVRNQNPYYIAFEFGG